MIITGRLGSFSRARARCSEYSPVRQTVRRVAATSAAVASLIIGTTSAIVANAPSASAATPPAPSAGALDSGFGAGGVATITGAGSGFVASNKLIVLPGGGIVVAAVHPGVAGSAVVAKLTSNGSLDTTFGNGGIAKPGLGSGIQNDVISLAYQPTTGDVIVAGSASSGGSTGLALARLTANGALDSTFGTNGIAFTNSVTEPVLNALSVAVSPSGSIGVVPREGDSGDGLPLLQFTANGSLDTSFGSGGFVEATGAKPPASLLDLSYTAGGQILAVGSVSNNKQTDTVVARFTSTGVPDTAFPTSGSQGFESFDLSGASVNDVANAVTTDGSGNILVSGTISTSPASSYVLRLTSTGARDSSFATNGLVTSSYDTTAGTGTAIAVDAAGRYLSAGSAGTSSSLNALGVERLTSGSNPFDSAFGVASAPGRESIACSSGTGGPTTAVASGADQHTVVAGTCNGVLTVARLNGGNLSNLAMTTSTPTVPAGHGTVPLASIPDSAWLASSSSLVGLPGYTTPGYTTPGYTTPGYTTPGYTTPGYTTAGFGNPGFFDPIRQSPLVDPNLGPIPLSSLPISPSPTAGTPTSWDDILSGTQYAGLATQTISLQQVLALSPVPPLLQALTLGQLDLSATPLRKASAGGFLLGTTPLSALPAPGGSWCNYLAPQPDNCTSNPSATSQSVLDLEIAGDNLQSYFANTTINLTSVSLVDSPLSFIPVNDVNLPITTLGNTLTTALATPSKFVTCTPSATSTSCDTLADAQKAGNMQTSPSANLSALIADSPNAVGTLALANLAGGLIPRQSVPIENIPAASIIANSPMPSAGAAYQVTFNMSCSVANSLAVTPSLPTDFRIIPSTASMTIGTGASAQTVSVNVSSGGSITPAQTVSCSGFQPVAVNFQAEPSTVMGPTSAGVTVSVSSDSLSVSNQAPVQVAKNFTPHDTSTNPNPATANTVYVGHIASPGDIDYFSLQPPTPGSTLTVTLSHMPSDCGPSGNSGCDYDLVMYGPAIPALRASPGYTTPGYTTPGYTTPGYTTPGYTTPGYTTPIVDPSTSFSATSTVAPPTLDPDVPRLNLSIRGYSVQRGTQNEVVSTRIASTDNQPFILQVSGYNGAWSNHPYVLRVSVTQPAPTLPCQSRTYSTSGVAGGSLPATPLSSGTQTLILVNEQRLSAIYGNVTLPDGTSGPAGQVIASHLQQLAQQSTVNGVVVPVEGDSTVASAYSAWDGSPCDVGAANQVVASINSLVDRLRNGLSQLTNVVVVGTDEVIPSGRVRDYTASYNESRFTEDAIGGLANAESSAAASGYILSDNPYGDLAPMNFLDSQLFVPQLAVGRLVETPADIAAQVNSFIAAGGATSPSTAFVTGYAPFDKGASQVASVLSNDVGAANTQSQINSTWTQQDAINGVTFAAHGYAVVNAHYDIYRALPAADFTNGTEAHSFSTADLPASLSGGVEWTIGCHAGLNVPDIYVANPTATQKALLLDWPQAELHNGAAAYSGNTGYGLGDTDAIAYSEKMNSLFAANLGPSMTIGQAMSFAKQQYVSSVGDPSVYDAKALQELTFYGLPMWRVGATGKSAPVALPQPPPSPTAPVTLASTTQTTPINNFVSHAASSGNGSYFTVGTTAPEVAPNEPIQPETTVALPQRSDGLVAHGAVLEQLSSSDVAGFTPVYDTPVADSTAFNPNPAISTAAFPSTIAGTSGTVGPNGRTDGLVLVPGQYFSAANGTGASTERLFNSVTSSVLYSNSLNFAPPTITSVTASIQGSVARFTVSTPATNIQRGVVLMLISGGQASQTWQHVELVNSGNGQWVGTTNLPSGTTSVGQYFAQLADGNGNVSVSSNKGQDYSAGSTGGFTVSVSPPPDPNTGLYSSPSVVTLTPPTGTTGTYSLDGSAPAPITGPITVSGQGGHTLVATASNGVTSTFGFPIDSNPPSVSITTPANGASYQRGSSVTPAYSCSSAVTIVSCVGPATVDTSRPGTKSYSVSATDAFGRSTTATNTYTVVDQPPVVTITSAPSDPTDQTSASISYSISDPDDSISTLTIACTFDGQSLPCTSTGATISGLSPGLTLHKFVVTVTDQWGQSSTASRSWHVYYDTTTTPGLVVANVPLSATVHYSTNGSGTSSPLAGVTVNFYAGQNNTSGQPICTAVTDSNGTATCSSVGPTATALVAGGVTAVFPGTPPYLRSQGSAGVL